MKQLTEYMKKLTEYMKNYRIHETTAYYRERVYMRTRIHHNQNYPEREMRNAKIYAMARNP